MSGFAIPVQVTPPAPPGIGQRVGKWATRKAGQGLLAILVKAPFAAVLLALQCCYFVANQTVRGRFRYHLRPVWVAGLAWYVAGWTPWAWLAVGYALALAPNPGRWISAREQTHLSRAAGLAAAWQILTPGLDLRVQAAAWVTVTAGSLFPFWRGRAWMLRGERPAPEVPNPLVEAWEWQVAQHPKAGPLERTVLRHDPATGRFHLRAPGDGMDGVEKADGTACRLMNRPRGTVTISVDPDGDANDFLVAFTDKQDGTVIRYADGPTLDEHGTIALADTADGRVARVALYTPAGAAHFLVLATNRYGKGVVMRNVGLELCLWDKAFLIVIDAKGDNDGGSGVPELRGHADVYAWRKTHWKAAIHLEHELWQARASRYSAAGQAFWHPNKPVDGYCDPLIAAMKDELRNIRKSIGRVEIDMLEQLSSMGATYGVAQYGDTQKGDADSTFSTAYRNDVRGNGTVCIGRAGDSQAAGIAAQGFDIDLSRLPNGQGWWLLKTSLTDVPLVPARARLYPTRDELEYQGGIKAPHGTVEDWLTMTKRAKLHPQDQDIVEKWRSEFEDAAVEPAPRPEPVREIVEVSAGVHVESAPKLHAVPDLQPDTKAAIDVIPDLLRQSGPMTRGQIATAAGISKEYASERLRRLKTAGVVAETTVDGKPGWKATA